MPKQDQYIDNIKSEVKILGTIFTENREEFVIKNLNAKTTKIKKILAYLEDRDISLFGKVLLTNSLILSQFWHTGCVIHLENQQINKIYNILNRWINGKKGGNITNQLMRSVENGGAGLLNLKNRLQTIKVKTLKALITGEWNKTFDIIVYWLGTRTQKLCGRVIVGPKCEKCTNKYEDIFKLLMKHKEKLTGIQDMKMKEIEAILFLWEENGCSYSGVYKGQKKSC